MSPKSQARARREWASPSFEEVWLFASTRQLFARAWSEGQEGTPANQAISTRQKIGPQESEIQFDLRQRVRRHLDPCHHLSGRGQTVATVLTI